MKTRSILFVAACLLLCLIPSVGMLFFPTTRTSENKPMAPAPQLMTQNGVNTDFFRDFESWFDQRVALRNEMVFADAAVQGVFATSNVSGVIRGTDGWLYYSSTLDDYLGRNVLSQRELFALSNNFSVVQSRLQELDVDFLLTIAPNKNTLYPQHMPYYSGKASESAHSARLLEPLLKVNYVSLFHSFAQQKEVLYLRRDSHWSNKGAALAYGALMDGLSLPHTDYFSAPATAVQNRDGDLNRMLYSFYGPAEEDWQYDLPEFSYTAGTNVEDGWITTEYPTGTGSLLMFRDSFGNTLIPFLSSGFAKAAYSKGEPNALERYVESQKPDCVIIEKVERNIADYLTRPPILTAPKAQLPADMTIANTDTTLQVAECDFDPSYVQLSGVADPKRLQHDTQVYVAVGDAVYRAYLTSENGYLLYLKQADLAEESMTVYAVTGSQCTRLLTQ